MLSQNNFLKDYLRSAAPKHDYHLDANTFFKDDDFLTWFPSLGLGYYPVKEFVYDENYFVKYKGYESTDVSRKLMQGRRDYVHNHANVEYGFDIVDIGIGSGEYCRWQDCLGFDVNPAGIDWLKKEGRFVDPYQDKIKIATFWDSLEHIDNPKPLLDNVTDWVFVSCPIYTDFDDVIQSKHFRTDEHFHYWTISGFIWLMTYLGFDLKSSSNFEEQAGRESIQSFAFKRTSEPRSRTC